MLLLEKSFVSICWRWWEAVLVWKKFKTIVISRKLHHSMHLQKGRQIHFQLYHQHVPCQIVPPHMIKVKTNLFPMHDVYPNAKYSAIYCLLPNTIHWKLKCQSNLIFEDWNKQMNVHSRVIIELSYCRWAIGPAVLTNFYLVANRTSYLTHFYNAHILTDTVKSFHRCRQDNEQTALKHILLCKINIYIISKLTRNLNEQKNFTVIFQFDGNMSKIRIQIYTYKLYTVHLYSSFIQFIYKL